MERIISKFQFGKFSCFFHTKWENDSFEISITDGMNFWENKVTKEYIEGSLLPGGMEISRYIQLVKSALKEQDKEKKSFQYALGKKGENLKLTWKIREVGEENLEFWVKKKKIILFLFFFLHFYYFFFIFFSWKDLLFF